MGPAALSGRPGRWLEARPPLVVSFSDTEAARPPLGGSVHLPCFLKLWCVVSYTPFLFLETNYYAEIQPCLVSTGKPQVH